LKCARAKRVVLYCNWNCFVVDLEEKKKNTQKNTLKNKTEKKRKKKKTTKNKNNQNKRTQTNDRSHGG
jgi:hypothetical protein